MRAQLAVRDSLVRDRAGLVTLSQAILSREGLQVPTGSSGCFGERVKRFGVPPQLAAGRFRGAHQVEAYLGLVPREWSSSEVHRRGDITKAGNSRMRWLLGGGSLALATHKERSETQALREWAGRIAGRRGQRVAMVALGTEGRAFGSQARNCDLG